MTRRSDDGLAYHSWFDSGLSLVERVIVLKSDSPDDEIDTNMSLHFIKCIATLENLNDKPICVILNSTGGDMYASLAIYDRIKDSHCAVCVRGYGAIMSGASIIMQAAGLRQMSPNSHMMVHNGSVMLDADIDKAQNWFDLYKNMGDVMYDIYYNNIHKINKKITRQEVIEMCQKETILNAEQAKTIGLIDQIYRG